ncbi:MAG: amino acid ABC transporter ATP-binding protein [Xanthomonadaceae bacterium]|nr:amino acid ABC transporter ATP-binding protein [Xanthomonadaceae bacterium]
MVQLRGLRKNLSGNTVLDGVDFDFEAGKLYVIIGRSGSGKSTLLRCINGLAFPDSGTVCVDGITLKQEPAKKKDRDLLEKEAHLLRSRVGMVFQSFNLFPHLTVLENVAQPQIIVKKTPVEEAHENAMKLLEKVGLKTFINRFPFQLSGGQQQRAAIARALGMSPRVMLYDEPTSALDPEKVDEVLGVMKTLDQERMSQIIVTHEMRFARDVADVVLFIEGGKVLESGSPDEMFTNPKHEETRTFLKRYL